MKLQEVTDIAKLIFKAPYYKFGHRNQSGQGRGGYLKYIATRDGVELLRSGMVMGICDLFYYATNIIDNRADDYYSKNKSNKIDKYELSFNLAL